MFAPWRRHTPALPVAEVTSIAGIVTGVTQRRHLAFHPLLIRHPICRIAIIAVACCPQPAVDAWADEFFWFAHR